MESALIREKHLVHFPETPLSRSRFGRLGRNSGVWMVVHKREVSNHEPERSRQVRDEPIERRVGSATLQALEIGVHHERRRRIEGALHVVQAIDRRQQL